MILSIVGQLFVHRSERPGDAHLGELGVGGRRAVRTLVEVIQVGGRPALCGRGAERSASALNALRASHRPRPRRAGSETSRQGEAREMGARERTVETRTHHARQRLGDVSRVLCLVHIGRHLVASGA